MKNKKVKNTAIAMGLIIGTVLSGATQTKACVNPESIKIEEQNGDTIARRLTEATLVEDSFTSSIYEKLDVDTVSHAIELSNLLNSYYPSPSLYSNTTIREIINVDIEAIYDEYKSIDPDDQERISAFCQKYLPQLAAIDGFTLCSQRTVSTEIASALVERIDEEFDIKGNPSLISEPEVIIDPIAINQGEQPFIIYTYETQLIKVILSGAGMEEINNAYITTNNEYNYLKAFLNGSVDEFSDSFVHQGVDENNEWTVYLSSGNDDRKEILQNGIDVINTIKCDGYDIEMDFTPYQEPIDENTKNYLIAKGYNKNLVNNSGTIIAYVDSPTLKMIR